MAFGLEMGWSLENESFLWILMNARLMTNAHRNK